MKTFVALLAFVVLLAWCSMGQAGLIIDGIGADDGDGAVVCSSEWSTALQTLTMDGVQYWGPGHIGALPLDEELGFLEAESEIDPSPILRTIMDNDTNFSWTAFDVSIYMSKSFTLSDVAVYYSPTGFTSESGWTGNTVGSVTEISTGLWRGQVHYTGGTPIPDGGTLDFSYKATFLGSAMFCQEMTPVPEPATLYLTMTTLLGLWAMRRRFARS